MDWVVSVRNLNRSGDDVLGVDIVLVGWLLRWWCKWVESGRIKVEEV